MRSHIISINSRVWILVLTCIALAALAFTLVFHPTAEAAQTSQIQVIQSDTSQIILDLSVPTYTSREQTVGGTRYTLLTAPGLGHTGEAGKPELPIRAAMVGIPPGAQASIQVLSDQSSSVALAVPPRPVPSAQAKYDIKQSLPGNPAESFIPDKATYSASQFYPRDVAKIASVGDWRSQHYVSVELHPFQYNPATRQLLFHKTLRVLIKLAYPGGLTTQALGSPVDEGPFDLVFQKAIVNYSSAKNWRSVRRAATPKSSPPFRSPEFYSGSPWYRIGVNADGMYQVTCGQIAAAAGNSLSISPGTLQVFKNGSELAINVVGTGWASCSSSDTADYVEFFGQAPDSKYTNTNIYWLTYGMAAGKRMSAADSTGIASTPTSFTNTVHLEQNLLYRPFAPKVEGADHWYWTYAFQGFAPTFPLPLSNLAPGTFSATLQADITPFTALGHHTRLAVNGNLVGDLIWSGQGEQKLSFDFPSSYLTQGSNTIQVTEPNDQDPNDAVFINNFDVGYQSTFTASSDRINFGESDSGDWEFQIGGFSNSNLEAFDVTDPLNVAKFNTLTISPGSPPFTVGFEANVTSPHQFIASSTAQLRPPTSVNLATSANLHNAGNGADYIIVSYGGFINNIMPLANYRASKGLRVKVVDVQNVYDEFSDGLVDPQAIRDFLAYAYNNWTPPAPSFVLLVGDGHYDPKEYCVPSSNCPGLTTTPGTEFVPPYLLMVDPSLGETDADNRMVTFNGGNTLPSMAIGRLPADTTADVDAMVAKILNYEQNPPAGSWQTKVTFVADKPDPLAGDFWQESDAVASDPNLLPASYNPNRIYYSSPQYPDPASAHQAVTQSIDNGSLIVNYVGHGYIYYWSVAQILCGYNDGGACPANDFASISNGSMTPIMLEMTCYTAYFVWPNVPSLGEVNLRTPGGGAVASWAATGTGISDAHVLLDQGFFNAVMQQAVYQLGPATILGKTNLFLNGGGSAPDLFDTFELLGDPATQLLVPKADVALTKSVVSKTPAPLGSSISYKIAFTNNGPGRAERVVITDSLSSLLFSPSFISSGVPITPTGGAPYVWNAGSLEPGAGGIITITATLDSDRGHYSSLTLNNTAIISTLTSQTTTSNDSSTTQTQVLLPVFLPFIVH